MIEDQNTASGNWAPMSRAAQTFAIIGTLVVLTGFLAWALWPAPNLDGVSGIERCEYSSWVSTHGGTRQQCIDEATPLTAERLQQIIDSTKK